jgi:hypothetical protein
VTFTVGRVLRTELKVFSPRSRHRMTDPKDSSENILTEPPKQKMWRRVVRVLGWLLKAAVGQLIACYVRRWTASWYTLASPRRLRDLSLQP